MSHIRVVNDEIELNDPTLVEGFPGAGLVGKIVADHLVEAMELTHYANVHCDALQKVAVYDQGSPELATPVRIYADDAGEIVVLQSDIPINPETAEEFAHCFSPWVENEANPVFIAGLPTKNRSSPPELFGVGTGAGLETVDNAGLSRPPERGVVSGPAGTLLNYALSNDLDAVGLIVETDPRFPDPLGAKVLLKQGIEPIIGRDVSVELLDEQAERIQDAKERLAKQMQEGGKESSEAKPIQMFQ